MLLYLLALGESPPNYWSTTMGQKYQNEHFKQRLLNYDDSSDIFSIGFYRKWFLIRREFLYGCWLELIQVWHNVSRLIHYFEPISTKSNRGTNLPMIIWLGNFSYNVILLWYNVYSGSADNTEPSTH